MKITKRFELSQGEVRQAIAEYIANHPHSGVPSSKGHRDNWSLSSFDQYRGSDDDACVIATMETDDSAQQLASSEETTL